MRYPTSQFGGIGYSGGESPGGVFGESHTIILTAAGLAVKDSNHKNLKIAGNGGADDDLENITGYSEGDMIIISPLNDVITITVKDSANLNLQGADFVMDDIYDSMVLLNIGSDKWKELSRSAN